MCFDSPLVYILWTCVCVCVYVRSLVCDKIIILMFVVKFYLWQQHNNQINIILRNRVTDVFFIKLNGVSICDYRANRQTWWNHMILFGFELELKMFIRSRTLLIYKTVWNNSTDVIIDTRSWAGWLAALLSCVSCMWLLANHLVWFNATLSTFSFSSSFSRLVSHRLFGYSESDRYFKRFIKIRFIYQCTHTIHDTRVQKKFFFSFPLWLCFHLNFRIFK